MTKSHSSETSIDSLEQEVLAAIDRYSGNSKDITAYGESESSKGFFLMFIKKDDSLSPEKRLEVSTMGQFINLQEVADCMDEVLNNIIQKNNVTNIA